MADMRNFIFSFIQTWERIRITAKLSLKSAFL